MSEKPKPKPPPAQPPPPRDPGRPETAGIDPPDITALLGVVGPPNVAPRNPGRTVTRSRKPGETE